MDRTLQFFLDLAEICQNRGLFDDAERYREYARNYKPGVSWSDSEDNQTAIQDIIPDRS